MSGEHHARRQHRIITLGSHDDRVRRIGRGEAVALAERGGVREIWIARHLAPVTTRGANRGAHPILNVAHHSTLPQAKPRVADYGGAMTNGPIHDVIERWHRHLRRELPGGLDALLRDDVVFISPVVFTPQQGKEITKLYLDAASVALPGEASDVGEAIAGGGDGSFHYVKEILDGHHAVLEFETTVDGKHVNGVDIITCDDDGMITEFKVMVRPLQAVNAVHRQMGEMLEKLKG